MNFENLLDIFLHLDLHLNEWITLLGPGIYLLLFLIIFCETGLVVTPFLPGDSLLFAIGTIAATDNPSLEVIPSLVFLSLAAILGDAANYSVGRYFGPKVFSSEENRWLNKKHLTTTQNFYNRHGGKTIIFARFLPIIRTFAPFVAGIGKMHYPRFALYNVTGGLLWVFGFLLAGYYFGNIPMVKRNFEFVILGIIFVSILPMIFRLLKSRGRSL